MTIASSSPSRRTPSSFVAHLQSGNEAAWHRLVDLYAPLIYSWCRRSDLTPEDSAEVVQDTLRSVWQGIGAFQQKADGTFRGWLRTIASNKIRDVFRRDAHEPDAEGGSSARERFLAVASEETPDGSSIQQSPYSHVVHEALERVKADFESHTWQAFWLTTVEGLSSIEAGEKLAMQPNAIRQAKFKVLRRLRQELGEVS